MQLQLSNAGGNARTGGLEVAAVTIIDDEAAARLGHYQHNLFCSGHSFLAGGGQSPPAMPHHADNIDAQIFSQPYLFRGPRPAIDCAPAFIDYGQTFAVRTAAAAAIGSVSLIRLSSVTHVFNQDQRFMNLAFTTDANQHQPDLPLTAAGSLG